MVKISSSVIRRQRESKGIKQDALHHELTQAQVSYLESRDSDVALSIVLDICETLGTTIDVLCPDCKKAEFFSYVVNNIDMTTDEECILLESVYKALRKR